MKKTSVYDWPTRLFHWLFAFLFLVAFIIAETVDDDSSLFSYHMLAGLTIVFLIILRIVWGFMGTTYARFSSFKFKPAELFRYFKDTLIAKTKRYLSHNPASSYAALIMFALAVGLGVTGVFMSAGYETDFYEEAHEILANLFLITVLAHLVGIVLHHLKHSDGLWSSMIDGKKKPLSGRNGITDTKPMAGIIFFIITLLWFGYINGQYDRDRQTLDVFGTELTLGEEEHEEHTDIDNIEHDE